jgi:hypothetical protein
MSTDTLAAHQPLSQPYVCLSKLNLVFLCQQQVHLYLKFQPL